MPGSGPSVCLLPHLKSGGWVVVIDVVTEEEINGKEKYVRSKRLGIVLILLPSLRLPLIESFIVVHLLFLKKVKQKIILMSKGSYPIHARDVYSITNEPKLTIEDHHNGNH